MAFPAIRRAETGRLAAEDRLLLYAARCAWHNPGRDRGRIIGTAQVKTSARCCTEPIEIAGVQFASECRLRIDGVVPYPDGVEPQPYAAKLAAFPKPYEWSAYLRRALVPLTSDDARLLEDAVGLLLHPRFQALATYPGADRLPGALVPEEH